MLLWLGTAVLAGGWTVEKSPPATERCPDGDGAPHTLGVAVVVYSRKQATMAWGHASLRAIYCVDGERFDVEYESYRMSAWNEEQLRYEHAGEAFLEGDWLRTQRGALVMFRNREPLGAGWFADAQRHNREIYELWLDLPQDELDRIVVRADTWYEEQRATLRAHADLPLRYRALSSNCTYVLQALLPDTLTGGRDPHLPFAWLRLLEARAERRVLRPSAHLLSRWSDGEVVQRPHPVFRRRPTEAVLARSGPAGSR